MKPSLSIIPIPAVDPEGYLQNWTFNPSLVRDLTDFYHRIDVLSPSPQEENAHLDQVASAIRWSNDAMIRATASGSNILLLSAATQIAANDVFEMEALASLDPMFGIIAPRNNLSGPYFSSLFDKNLAARSDEPRNTRLPRYQIIPSSPGVCLYVKNKIIANFGVFDPIYEDPFYCQDDLIRRMNRCGFQMVLSNRAFAHTSLTEGSVRTDNNQSQRSRQIIASRYPEYLELLQRYHNSCQRIYERLVATDGGAFGHSESATIPREQQKVRIIFDLSHLGSRFDGTNEYGSQLVKNFYQINRHNSAIEVAALCSEKTAEFHQLHDVLPIGSIFPLTTEEVFDVAIKPCQPFSLEEISRLNRLAKINLYIVLDSIAADCGYISSRRLHGLWRLMGETADGLAFLSSFSADRFNGRVKSTIPQLRTMLCSLDLQDYTPLESLTEDPLVPADLADRILVIGNNYCHKGVRPLVQLMAENFSSIPLLIVGIKDCLHPNSYSYNSGEVSAEQMAVFYNKCRAVVFPSYYEGLGFPLLRGLAARKTVFVQDSLLITEILELWNGPTSLVAYSDIKDFQDRFLEWVRLDPKPSASTDERGSGLKRQTYGWREACANLLNFVEELREIPDSRQSENLFRRIDRLNQLETAHDAEDYLHRIHILENIELTRIRAEIESVRQKIIDQDDLLKQLDQARTEGVNLRNKLAESEQAIGHYHGLFLSVTNSRTFKFSQAITSTAKKIIGKPLD